MHPYDVLLRPLLSEKSNRDRENHRKYSFAVRTDASKKDIKRAVEKMFDVEVTDVRTMITRDKLRRRQWWAGGTRPPRVKKAMITLKGDTKIGLFEDL